MRITPTATIEFFDFSPCVGWKLEMIFWFRADGACQDYLVNIGVVFG